MDEVRWGIIGVGAVCEKKAGPAFQKCQGSTLVAVMRRTTHLAKDFAARHGVPRFYDNVEALIQDTTVNALYIATPPGTHLEIAMKCVRSGKPTYIEKPIARNATETRAIVEAFANAGVPLYCAYYRRGQPKFVKAKELLASNVLGKITSIDYTMLRPTYVMPQELPWRFVSRCSGGGLLMDVGCHTIDALDYMMGCPLTQVMGHASNVNSSYNVEDSVSICARMVSEPKVEGSGPRSPASTSTSTSTGTAQVDAHVRMLWSFAGPPDQREDLFVIRGTLGTMTLSTFGTDPIVVERTPAPTSKTTTKTSSTPSRTVVETYNFDPPEHAHQPLVQTIVNELRGVADFPSPSRSDNGLRVAIVMDQALENYYMGRADEFWNREETWAKNRD